MLTSADLNFSFSGLKTAVLLAARRQDLNDLQARADLARAFQDAIVEVLATKALAALEATGLERLVVAGGVGANRQLRERLRAAALATGYRVYYPEPELCTDNGAMIALAGALRLVQAGPLGLHRARLQRPAALGAGRSGARLGGYLRSSARAIRAAAKPLPVPPRSSAPLRFRVVQRVR